MDFPRYSWMLLLGLVLNLTACGGGGGDGDGSAAGVVSAGPSATQITSVAVTIPTSSYAAASAQLGGWTVLQTARALCGFGALRPNTAYQVKLVGNVDGTPFNRTFTLSTGQ